MKYGFFDDINKEYVITTPKTPLPWINYLGCKDFFTLMSNTCGGYTFYKDAKLLRMTRYRYNDTTPDTNGKYFYIKDGDKIWNPGWQPTKTKLDSYECRHGIGYSKFTGAKNRIEATLTTFVPIDDPVELTKVTITNNNDSRKDIKLFSYVEWCLWNADDDMKNYQRNLSIGEVEVIDSTIYHKTEYRERRNHYAVYSVNANIDGFETSRDEFRGAKVLQDQLLANEKIKPIYDTVVDEVVGKMSVEKLILSNKKTGEKSELPVQGVFMAVGIVPNLEGIEGLPDRDEGGYIIAGETCETSIPGIFAAGDVRTKQLRQVITAAADGANAITSVERYFNS
mgnify:CR=1 FL=1